MSRMAGLFSMRPVLVASAVAFACVAACAASAYDVRVLRDEWGTPHLFGKTDADAAYGLGYANSEDDWTNMEHAVLLGRGLKASVAGEEYARFDYLVRLFRVREFVDDRYETDLSEEARAVLEGYAAGVTHYASLHPEKMPHVELPVTGKDILANNVFMSPFFYLLQIDLEELFAGAEEVPPSKKDILSASARPVNPLAGGPGAPGQLAAIGSNGWVVGRSRSADGKIRLAVNSHMPWTGPVSYYEAHVHSEEGWDMLGCTFAGGPLIYMGHDRNKGWCHTINRPDLADIYVLEMNPDNPGQYKFDGEWRDLQTATAAIKVLGKDGTTSTVERELLWSVHGPAVRRTDGVFAIRFSGYGEIRQVEQWYRMNKAGNLEEFLAAMRTMGLPSLNTLYADKSGNVLYVYGGLIPVRAEGFDWRKPVPGNTSETMWNGYYGFDRIPQVLNPPSGFIQNCNSTPFRTTVGDGNPEPASFPKSMGIEGHDMNRSRRARALYGGDESITREEFMTYKYDKTYTAESEVGRNLGLLLQMPAPDDPPMKEAFALLKDWDLRVTKDNRGAALAMTTAALLGSGQARDPLGALRMAVERLMKHYGKLDVAWQEVLRLRRGNLDLPLGGGPDCLRAVELYPLEDGRIMGVGGDCYFQVVEWDRDGRLHSEAIHQFGSGVGDPASPHYADQAPLFAEERMRPALLEEEDIRRHLEREYRPGELAGPWYAR